MKRLTFVFKTKKEEPVVALVCMLEMVSMLYDTIFKIKGYRLEIGLLDNEVASYIHLTPEDVELLTGGKLECYIKELEQEIKDVH